MRISADAPESISPVTGKSLSVRSYISRSPWKAAPSAMNCSSISISMSRHHRFQHSTSSGPSSPMMSSKSFSTASTDTSAPDTCSKAGTSSSHVTGQALLSQGTRRTPKAIMLQAGVPRKAITRCTSSLCMTILNRQTSTGTSAKRWLSTISRPKGMGNTRYPSASCASPSGMAPMRTS